MKPNGLFVISIHQSFFTKGGFKNQLESFGPMINNLKIHKVYIYGKIGSKFFNKDKVLITIFRKNC